MADEIIATLKMGAATGRNKGAISRQLTVPACIAQHFNDRDVWFDLIVTDEGLLYRFRESAPSAHTPSSPRPNWLPE